MVGSSAFIVSEEIERMFVRSGHLRRRLQQRYLRTKTCERREESRFNPDQSEAADASAPLMSLPEEHREPGGGGPRRLP